MLAASCNHFFYFINVSHSLPVGLHSPSTDSVFIIIIIIIKITIIIIIVVIIIIIITDLYIDLNIMNMRLNKGDCAVSFIGRGEGIMMSPKLTNCKRLCLG